METREKKQLSNLFHCSVQALGAGVTFAIVFRTQLAWNRPAEMGACEVSSLNK